MVKFRRGTGSNLEDRRGRGGTAAGVGAVGGIGGLILLLFNVFAGGGGGGDGIDITEVLKQFDQTQGSIDPADDEVVRFMSDGLDDIQGFWAEDLETYRPAKLVLFTSGVSTACGNASSAIGPFYCPPDEKVYLDLSFFRELRDRFGAPGDFAQAYVLAHEVGHHVQKILGTSDFVNEQQQSNPGAANDLSVRLELQADCYAGVWGASARDRGILEAGDLEEGLAAAASVGDDRIQAQAGVEVNPETWTHGSAEQRTRWFKVGFDSGDRSRCDTFAASNV
jgi:predicted metalloprotease